MSRLLNKAAERQGGSNLPKAGDSNLDPADPRALNNENPTAGASEEDDADQDDNRGVMTPRRHDVTTSRSRGVMASDDAAVGKESPKSRRRGSARRPAPRAEDAVALTVRWDPAEMITFDQTILELRSELGARVDKAEVVRELVRMVQEEQATRRTLIRRLRK